MVTASTQVVIDYLTRRDEDWNDDMAAWTAATVPASVRHAILVQLRELYERTPDEKRGPDLPPATLSPTVLALLMRYRDPGYA
jgi:hypothetical protein